MEKHTIAETKELVTFVVALMNAGGKAMEDGKVGIEDATHLLAPLMSAAVAFGGVNKVPVEIAELDAAEAAELVQHIKAVFEIPQDNIEQVVEVACEVGLKLWAAIAVMRAAKA